MKTFISIVLIMIAFSISGISQKNIDQVLRKYKNDEGVINMNFTGEVLNLLAKSETKIQSSIDLVDIIVFEKGQDISASDMQKIKSVIDRDKFDLLIDIKNKDQKVKVYALENGKHLDKVFANVNSNELNAYFILSGKIIFSELAKLNMDFTNGDALKMFTDKKK